MRVQSTAGDTECLKRNEELTFINEKPHWEFFEPKLSQEAPFDLLSKYKTRVGLSWG